MSRGAKGMKAKGTDKRETKQGNQRTKSAKGYFLPRLDIKRG